MPSPASSFVRAHRWKLLLPPLLLAGVTLQFTACSRSEPASEWLTAPVRSGHLEDTVLANGVLRANTLVNVGAQVSGQVKALHVKLGDNVRKGQLIAEVDPTEQRNALRDERAAIAVMRAQRASRISALAQARANLTRQQAMMREDATSKQDLQAAQAQFESASSDLKVLDAQLRQSDIKLETAATKLGYTRIVAPMDGVVVAVVTEAGQTLNSVQSVPTVIKLARLDPMLVEAQISEADVPKVKAGMPAWFTLLGDGERRYQSQLKSVDPGPTDLAKETSAGGAGGNTNNAVYYNALLEVPNPDGQLRIAMSAKVSIITRSAKNVLIVPSAALGQRQADGRYAVRVALPGKNGAKTLDQRLVRIGLDNRVNAEAIDGLKAGEEVVIGKDTSRQPLDMGGAEAAE
ncbi:efflux RND transporter periplasmic adaptor subunit [Solilutibacter pythonis]|nr:efflux RND transporter periplasmic adaptor subunit [Lysobacter pythonis]